jgi:DNA-binding response OmpR family regulator
MHEPALLLVIEDDEQLVKLVERVVSKAGIAIISASDGEEGLRLARQRSPDVILLDIMLPKLDGRDVLRQLTGDDATRSIPVIILSARGDHVERIAGLALGAEEYLEKPYSTGILLNRIEQILWKQRNPE